MKTLKMLSKKCSFKMKIKKVYPKCTQNKNPLAKVHTKIATDFSMAILFMNGDPERTRTVDLLRDRQAF